MSQWPELINLTLNMIKINGHEQEIIQEKEIWPQLFKSYFVTHNDHMN